MTCKSELEGEGQQGDTRKIRELGKKVGLVQFGLKAEEELHESIGKAMF